MARRESTMTQDKVAVQLNKQVANLNVLYVKIHNFHWNVKGPSFFSLHVKFEELYKEISLIFDEVAERIIGIGGKPAATMKEYMELASIKEAKGGEDPSGMVQTLADDFSTVVEEMKDAAANAEEQEDEPTADMLVTIQEKLQKHIWMLKAYLGK